MQAPQRRLTDKQLADARLEIDDPELLPNLSKDRPDAQLEPQIIGEYHLGRGHEPIWCCHCQAHRHWNGFVVSNATQKNYLIGSTCGPKHYGLSFSLARNQHQTLSRRKAVLERFRNICITSDITLASIAVLQNSDGLRRIDLKRAEFIRASEQVANAISTSIQNGSPLYENVEVRDFDAERRRDANLRVGKSGDPIYSQQRRPLGMVAGPGLFRRPDCRDNLLALKEAVKLIRNINRTDTDGYSLQSLAKAVKVAEDAWENTNKALDEAEGATRFFSPDNLNRLERWSDTFSRFSLRADGNSLWVIDGKSTLVAPLDDISLSRIPPMKPELVSV